MNTGFRFSYENSNLFQFCQLEREAVAYLREAESQKAGHDIGEDRAQWLWVTTERSKWLWSLKGSGVLP